ncbi:MAG TPA: hypothetical protein VFJ43_06525 [Bacteroidia bacterium]|nr:hypothetical protein [Bacteroidia bacterium]
MSKESSTALYELVQRMSKSEKRYFKLMASRHETGEGKFIRLFDRLERMKKYDDKKIVEDDSDLSRRQIANQKSFLYDYLLKCLRSCNSPGATDIILADLIGYARILYDKCLYRDCIRMIDRAKKLAIKNERTVQLLELLDLEKLVIKQTVNVNHAKRVEETVLRTQKVLQEIETVNKFENLSIRLNVFYVQTGFIRDKNDLLKVEHFFHKALPSYDERKLNFHEKLYLYYALTGYYFFIQDFRNGYRYAKEWVGLFDDRPEMVRNHTELYIRALNSLLVVLNKFSAIGEFETVHRRLVALKRREDREMTENINLNLFKAIYVHEINRHFIRGEFRSGTRVVSKLQHELNQLLPLLDHNSVLLIDYKIACLYFGADQYKNALYWLNRIIREKDISVREDLHAFARILALICHNELGNDLLAESHIKSLYRFLLKKGNLTAYHKLILSFIRKLHRNLSPKELNRLFLELKEKMQPLTKQRFEKRAFYYFDIISWLESKIEKRSIEEVIKTKFRNSKNG